MSKKIEPDFSQAPGPALHSARWRFGAFELDETRRELRRDGELLALEPKPLNMLMLLLRHPGELVTKNELLEALWTGRVVNEAVVGNCIASVREGLGSSGPLWLKTVHGFGYRFDAPVQLIEDDNKAPTIAAPKLDFQPGDQPPMRPNWQLVRRLGRSGDSWLGEHVKTRARRVFKFTTDPRGLSALKREVTVYRLLRESVGDKVCYVDLLDWNFDEAPWFVEAEYCPGGSLQEWFEAKGGIGKVPLATRLDLIAQIAEALAEIHLVGILHKDLKPANIFVVTDTDGRPAIRLADFGSSRLLDPNRLAALEITRMGFTQVIDADADGSSGTPLYLAPEVLAGHPATVKADIYALGVMLYQFAIGNLRRQLAAGWEAEVEDGILRDDIAAAAEGNPERRLADASELARNLRRLESRRVAREAERAAAEKAERAARALERMKARRVGVMVAFGALAIGFVTSVTLYIQATRAQHRAETETARAQGISAYLGRDVLDRISADRPNVRSLTVKELLDSASGSIDERFVNDPRTAAEIHASLAHSYAALEYFADARRHGRLALEGFAALGKGASDNKLALTSRFIIYSYASGNLRRDLPLIDELERSLAGEKTPPSARLNLSVDIARSLYFLGEWTLAEERIADVAKAAAMTSDVSNRVRLKLAMVAGLIDKAIGAHEKAVSNLREAEKLAAADTNVPRIQRVRLAVERIEAEAATAPSAALREEIETLVADADSWGGEGNGEGIFAAQVRGQVLLALGEKPRAESQFRDVIAAIRLFYGDALEAQHLKGPASALAELQLGDGRPEAALATINEALTATIGEEQLQHPDIQHLRLIRAEAMARLTPESPELQTAIAEVGDSFVSLPDSHRFNGRLRELRRIGPTREVARSPGV